MLPARAVRSMCRCVREGFRAVSNGDVGSRAGRYKTMGVPLGDHKATVRQRPGPRILSFREIQASNVSKGDIRKTAHREPSMSQRAVKSLGIDSGFTPAPHIGFVIILSALKNPAHRLNNILTRMALF